MKKYLIYLSLFYCTSLQAQHWSIGGEFGGGYLIKHSQQIKFNADPWNYYSELHLNFQTGEQLAWAKYYRFPQIKIAGRVQQYVENDLLGRYFGLYPAVSFPIAKHSNFPFSFMAGTGIAWASKKYDRTTLPLNNAIGSHLNNLTVLKFELGLPIFYKLTTDLTFSMSHLSNGRTTTPNLGLNTFHFGIQISQLASHRYVNVLDTEKRPSWEYSPWYFEVGTTIGFHQTITIGGPRYCSYGLRSAVVRSITPVQRLSMGLELEYNTERADFYLGSFEVNTRKEANWKATSFGIFIRDEFLFGPVGLGITAGLYIRNEQTASLIFNKLDLRYYFGNNKKGSGAYFALVLKSHKAVAQYLGGGIGYLF